MPIIIESEVEGAIKAFSKMNLSYNDIKDKLAEDQIYVSKKTIGNVLNCVGIRRSAINQGGEVPKKRYLPVKRTNETIQEVKRLVNKENPATYDSIQSITGISRPTISKIIHNDLGLRKRKKNKSSSIRSKFQEKSKDELPKTLRKPFGWRSH